MPWKDISQQAGVLAHFETRNQGEAENKAKKYLNAWCELITGIHGRCPQLVELLYLQNKEHFYG
jgi:hypothetical protein